MAGQIHSDPFAIVPEWLLDADVSDRAVRLFGLLNRYANEKGRAFPGRRKVAERLRCSESSLDRAIEELKEVGALATTARFRDDGGRSTNDYWLWPKVPGVKGPVPTGDDAAVPAGDEAITRASKEREPVTTVPSPAATTATLDEDFETFWRPYPRKTDKGGARKAYARAARRTDRSVILAGVLRFAADPNLPEAQFVPHASTWLNGERWNDGPLPARARVAGRQGSEKRTLGALATIAQEPRKAIG